MLQQSYNCVGLQLQSNWLFARAVRVIWSLCRRPRQWLFSCVLIRDLKKIIKISRNEGQEKVSCTNRAQFVAWSSTCPSISCTLSRVIGSVMPERRNPSSLEEVYFLSRDLMSNNERPPTDFHLGQWSLESTVTGCFVTPLLYAKVKTDTSTIATPLVFLQNQLRD